MNPIGFALAGAVLLTTSLAAFDTFGKDAPMASAEIVRSEAVPAVAAGQAVNVAATETPRRPVRVILSSPYGQRG